MIYKNLIDIYNENIIYYEYVGLGEDRKGVYKRIKTSKNKKFEVVINIFKETLRLKDITRILNKKRTDLSKLSTRQLLKEFKNRRFYNFGEQYHLFWLEGGLTCVIELKKELDKREHIPAGIEAKRIRQYCAKYKVSKEEAMKRVL